MSLSELGSWGPWGLGGGVGSSQSDAFDFLLPYTLEGSTVRVRDLSKAPSSVLPASCGHAW